MSSSMMEVLAGTVQSHDNHRDEVAQSIALTQLEIEQEERFHNEQLRLHNRIHREQVQLMRDQHAAAMHLHVELGRRDAIRDVFTQRSQATQTIMINNALLLLCDFGMIYTLVPPKQSPPWSLALYSTALALALLCLALSTFTALQLQGRMVRYDLHRHFCRYSCGRSHPTFSSYFECHCRVLEQLSIKLFYLGTTLTMIGATILMYLTFAVTQTFHSVGAGVVYVVISALGIFGLWVLDFVVPSATHRGTTDITGVRSGDAEAYSTQASPVVVGSP